MSRRARASAIGRWGGRVALVCIAGLWLASGWWFLGVSVCTPATQRMAYFGLGSVIFLEYRPPLAQGGFPDGVKFFTRLPWGSAQDHPSWAAVPWGFAVR